MPSRSEATDTTPLPHSIALRAAENDLQTLRGRLRTVAEFIHDPAHDFAARHALALSLGLPVPTPTPAARQTKEATR
ncbi:MULTISPECIES: hypothetical protein [Streptomyces]|uniref:hypothetical protein n=1 Tax=Streptomyces scabiei TaxID=1930 RepID=UPI001B3322AE|nr:MULTISPECIES: hypothetical protein [Streptomyces]MBP5888705.1 hypothetical protein [Streptomyces sp. LBUM 1487]MDW8478430.1 hypothetical protein [Streptomyces scabiei]